jgi:hypothetical protein
VTLGKSFITKPVVVVAQQSLPASEQKQSGIPLVGTALARKSLVDRRAQLFV